MNIKAILKNPDFVALMTAVSNMNISVIKPHTEDNWYGAAVTKTRFDFSDILQNDKIYDNCFAAFKSAAAELDKLYLSEGAAYPTKEEFVVALFDDLKNYTTQTAVLKSDNQNKPRTFSTAETNYYETKRLEYIRAILTQSHGSVNRLAAVKILETATINELAIFIDSVEAEIDNMIAENKKNPTMNLPDREWIIYEYLFSYLPDSFREGDNLTTKKININTERFSGKDAKYKDIPNYLKVLAFLENQILCDGYGLTANNIAFDGFRFFDTKSGKTVVPNSKELHKQSMQTAARYSQTNLVLNEDFAEALLNLPKKHSLVRGNNYAFSKEVVDGETIEVTRKLYRCKVFQNDKFNNINFYTHISLGYFVKVKEYNRANDTYSFILYYFCDDGGEKGIQLFRIDKVADTFKGAAASHNLRGKEKIETVLHTHRYNLIDAVLKNYTKDESLGKMDLDHIFPTADGLDIEMVEELFDYFCGIHGQYLKHINDQKFTNLQQKYLPLGMGDE